MAGERARQNGSHGPVPIEAQSVSMGAVTSACWSRPAQRHHLTREIFVQAAYAERGAAFPPICSVIAGSALCTQLARSPSSP
jgi:hypothetical protein